MANQVPWAIKFAEEGVSQARLWKLIQRRIFIELPERGGGLI